MNYIGKEIINEIRFESDIIKIVSEYIELHKKGKDYYGLCPFHKGKNTTFSVVPEKQIYYCFECKKGGNVFNFIMEMNELSYIETVKYLAKKIGFEIDKPIAKEPLMLTQKDEIIEINQTAGKYFYVQLCNTKNIMIEKVFEEYGISKQVIKKFGLGYSLDSWDALYKFLISQKYSPRYIKHSGLVFESSKGNLIDRFRNRLMVPLFNQSGKLTGFCGISLDNSQAKYLYTPDSRIFGKKSSLFGLNIVKKSQSKKVIIFERFFDVLLVNQFGVDWALTMQHYLIDATNVSILKKFNEGIIVVFSSQTLSENKLMTNLKILKENGCNIKIFEKPNNHTVKDLILNNKEQIGNYFEERSKSLLDFIIDNYLKCVDQSDIIKIVNGVIDILAIYGDEVECEVYALIYSSKYNISYDSFICELKKRKYDSIKID